MLRELVLTQLEKIVTTVSGTTGGSHIESGKSSDRMATRRPHRRRLSSGKGFTQRHARFVLEKYGVDLVRYNGDRGLTKETGQVTYVGEGGISFEHAKKMSPLERKAATYPFLSKGDDTYAHVN
jgi:hypothetical protein